MSKRFLLLATLFLFSLFLIVPVSAQPEQLKALITDAEIQSAIEQAKTGADFTNKDALYYSKFINNTYYASVCHGGSRSLGCKERVVKLNGNYYEIANPVAVFGIGGAHYLNTSTDDYLVVKLLGELWFIKPHWNDSEQCYFDVWKWTPSENFFVDASYNLSACEGQGSAVFPKSKDFYTVSAYENSCGIAFDISCRSGSWPTGTDVAIKNIKINSQYFEELKARAQTRESRITPARQIPNECGFKIASVRYKGQTYDDPNSLTYYAETAEPMSVSFVIDNSKCNIQQMVFGLWESAEPIGYPPIDIYVGSDIINSLNENGSANIEVSFSDARDWAKKYMAARVFALPSDSTSARWISSQVVEITFSSGTGAGGQTQKPPEQGLTNCSACSSLLQCLACIDMLILESIP